MTGKLFSSLQTTEGGAKALCCGMSLFLSWNTSAYVWDVNRVEVSIYYILNILTIMQIFYKSFTCLMLIYEYISMTFVDDNFLG